MSSIENYSYNKISWKNLDNLTEIAKNLCQSDKIQFSLACKRYRGLLSPIIFNRLRLFNKNMMIPWNERERSNKRKLQFSKVTNQLSIDILNKAHFVKEVEFYQAYNNQFAVKFFKLFSNIKFIKYSIDDDDLMCFSLANTLKNADKLVKVESCNNLPFNLDLERLRMDNHIDKVIKSLRKLELEYGKPWKHNYPLEVDDTIFGYLTKLTIFDSSMLQSLNFKLPALKEVQFNSGHLNPTDLTRFINKNLELERIKIASLIMVQALMAAIFNLSRLEYLEIDSFREEDRYNFVNSPGNESIKHLILGSKCLTDDSFSLISHCKNLKILELRPKSFTTDAIAYIERVGWNTYNGKDYEIRVNTI